MCLIDRSLCSGWGWLCHFLCRCLRHANPSFEPWETFFRTGERHFSKMQFVLRPQSLLDQRAISSKSAFPATHCETELASSSQQCPFAREVYDTANHAAPFYHVAMQPVCLAAEFCWIRKRPPGSIGLVAIGCGGKTSAGPILPAKVFGMLS